MKQSSLGWKGPIENQQLGPKFAKKGPRPWAGIHNLCGTPTYRSWQGMIQRCTNPNNPRWLDYGGRGIGVCEKWKNFSNFLDDMGVRPVGKSLDRKDNSLGYYPENCRWSSPIEQQNTIIPLTKGTAEVSNDA